jgi:small subunit ribosomal protein S9
VARGSAKSGAGKIRINHFDVNTYEPIELRRIMLEPIRVSGTTHDIARKLDIDINVYGGGQSSQAQAIRGVIAKCIEKSSGGDSVRKEYLHYDRFMLIDDSRRVEPKKFKGPKARARFQKSYR